MFRTCLFLCAGLLSAVGPLSAQVTFVQNGNGQYLDTSSDGDKHYEVRSSGWSVDTIYNKDRNGNAYLANISNWSTPHPPSSPMVDVAVNVPSTLDGNFTVGTLSVGASGTVAWTNGSTLTIANGALQDNGLLTISNNPAGSVLAFSAAATISGGGAIRLNDTGGNGAAQITSTATLTQATDHTIYGAGQINAPLVNNGLVTSNQSQLGLGAFPMTNTGTLEAVNGKELVLSQTALTQGANGQVLSDGGYVTLNAASITGGQLNAGASGGVFRGGGVTLTNVTNNATLSVNGYAVAGTLTDNGVVRVLGNPYQGTLTLADGAVLAGPGAVTMTQAPYSLVTVAAGGTATQAAGHTLNGTGHLGGSLVNNGVIQATGFIYFNRDAVLTNNGVIATTANAGMESDGATFTQGAGGYLLADATRFSLGAGGSDNHATVITGGVLSAVNGGTFYSSTSRLNGVTNNAVLNAAYAAVGGGSLTNNGTVNILGNPYLGQLDFVENASLLGTGVVVATQGGYPETRRADLAKPARTKWTPNDQQQEEAADDDDRIEVDDEDASAAAGEA